MKLSFAFAALVSLSLAACGGKSKPAETTGGGGDGDGDGAAEKVAADCCCDFIEETPIDESGEETAENQVYRMMTKAECDENSGQCGDAANCTGTEEGAE